MAAKLLIFRSDGIDRVELAKRDLRIGRAPENDIVLQDEDKSVSRYHAELRHEQGDYVLIDVNSQNGIWVDGRRVQRTRLEPGRPVVLGKVRIELEDLSAGVALAPAGASTVQPAPLSSPAPAAALTTSRTLPAASAGVESVRASRAGTRPAAPTRASRILAPRMLAIGLGVVLVAVVALMLLRPSAPTSEPSSARQPALSVLRTTTLPGAHALTRPETPLSAYGRALPGSVMNADEDRLTGEAARQQRIRNARVALARDDYGRAIQLLEGLPASADADQLRNQARALRAQRAEGLMRDGERFENSGDLETATRRYMGARSVDPATPGIEEALARVLEKMKVAGTEAYKEARQYDAFGQTAVAIPLYERAVAFLPLDDPNRAAARARLIELKKEAR
ncbi:MAG: FHA domain-containing protein [Vicinamibacteraceae bacterium]